MRRPLMIEEATVRFCTLVRSRVGLVSSQDRGRAPIVAILLINSNNADQ